MSRLLPLAALLGVLLIAFFTWKVFFPGDEAKIRKVLDTVARAASVTPNEGSLGRLTKAAELAALCTANVEIRVDALGMRGGLDGRDEVRSAAMNLGNSFGTYRIITGEVRIRDLSADQARVTLTARFEGSVPADISAQEFELRFKKVEGRWLIQRVQTLQALRR